MSETATTERTTEQATAPVPGQASVSEVTPEAPKPSQDAAPRPRIPRPHCAC